mgnify:CR=1 FL=1|jgi:hypothetical protein
MTHNTDFAEAYADRLIKIESGKIVEERIINSYEKSSFSHNISNQRKNDSHIVKNFLYTNLRMAKIKTIFTILLFSIFLFFSLIFTSFLAINSDKAYAKYLKENNHRYLTLGNSDSYQLDYHEFDDIDAEIKNFCLPYFENTGSIRYTKEPIWVNFIFVVDDNDNKFLVGENEVLITDYVADLIINDRSKDAYSSYQDLIGFEIKIKNHVLKVGGVTETNYQEDGLDTEGYNKQYYYLGYFINKKTLGNLYNINNTVRGLVFYSGEKELGKSSGTKFIVDKSLSDNQVLISKDLVNLLPSDFSFKLSSNTGILKIDCINQGIVIDEAVVNSIYISEEIEKELDCIYDPLIDIRQHEPPYNSFEINFSLDQSLVDNEVIMSNDLMGKLLVNDNILRLEKSWPHGNTDVEFKLKSFISDDNIKNTIYVSAEMYQELRDYSLDGGLIVNINDNALELITVLKEKGLYINTRSLDDYKTLNKAIKIAFIPALILTTVSIVVLIIMFNSFLSHRIEMRQKDYIILRCLGNSTTIKKIIFLDIAFILTLAFITSMILLMILSSSINKLLSYLFFPCTTLSTFFAIIITLFLTILTLIYIGFAFIKKLNKLLILNVIK